MADDRIEAIVRRLHDEHTDCPGYVMPPSDFHSPCDARCGYTVGLRAAVLAGLELAAEMTDRWQNTVATFDAKEALTDLLVEFYSLAAAIRRGA